jgi:fatty-acyl-CoA synthase
VGDQIMVALQLADGATFDPDELAAFLRDQPDLGTVWTPRYVRVSEQMPATETNKVLKRVMAREAWETSDPVWVRDGDGYRPLGDEDRAQLRGELAAHGRAHLVEAVRAP